MPGIMDRPEWDRLRRFFRIEKYDRDGGHGHPRIRIEVDAPPGELLALALALTMPCVACGRAIHPIRLRNPRVRRGSPGHLYYAPCCPLDVNVGCSRGPAAREEYERFRTFGPVPAPTTGDLFPGHAAGMTGEGGTR